MSRLKSFPKEIEIGINKDGEFILLPEKVDWLLAAQIKKVQKYSLATENPDVPRKRRQRKPKTEPQPEPKLQKTENKAMFKCTACGKDVDNPSTVPGGEVQCPHCLRLGTVVGKEDA